MASAIQIFAGSASQALAARIATVLGQPLGNMTLQKFSDGELYPVFHTPIRGIPVFLIQATYPPATHIIELLLMLNAAQQAGAHPITVVAPYLGYMRQDRMYHAGGSVAMPLKAQLLTAAGADRLITCDVHTTQLPCFFNGPVVHLKSASVLLPYIKQRKLPHPIVAAPDAGSIARAQHYAQALGVGMVFCNKHRKKANQIAKVHVVGTVADADILLLDDMVDTGRTICKAAAQLKAKGARTVHALCTHPVLSGNAYQTIATSLLDSIVVTDTIPLQQASSKLKVVSMAVPFATAIKQNA